MEAPSTAPTAGKAAEEALVGAGAGASAARATVAEAAATRTAQATFFISIATLIDVGCRTETRKIEGRQAGLLISKMDQWMIALANISCALACI